MAAIDYSFFPTGWVKYPEDKTWDRYKHYLRDKSLVRYGASLLDESIKNAAGSIVSSVNTLSDTVAAVGDRICAGLQDINNSMKALNRRTDIIIEHQRMTNLMLQNIIDLLKIPDSEKERQQSITNGIRFLANANINPSLYNDALDEFIKAERLQRQDFFVLHRIGCIYLYSEENLDPEKAHDYFTRAAKYAKVESNPNAIRMANLLTNPINHTYTQTISDVSSVHLLAADSLEKAAFAAYVANDLTKAIECQQQANELHESPNGLFLLSKYQSHEGNLEISIPLLQQAINSDANMATAVFQEVDMMVRQDIVDFLDRTDKEVNEGLEELLSFLKGRMNTDELYTIANRGTFVQRMNALKRYRRRLKR